jgi:hypothetical protein
VQSAGLDTKHTGLWSDAHGHELHEYGAHGSNGQRVSAGIRFNEISGHTDLDGQVQITGVRDRERLRWADALDEDRPELKTVDGQGHRRRGRLDEPLVLKERERPHFVEGDDVGDAVPINVSDHRLSLSGVGIPVRGR